MKESYFGVGTAYIYVSNQNITFFFLLPQKPELVGFALIRVCVCVCVCSLCIFDLKFTCIY